MPDVDQDAEVSFSFALAKAYEDQKDYERAFEYYKRGNEKKRMLVQYDPYELEYLVDGLTEVFSRDFIQERDGWGQSRSGAYIWSSGCRGPVRH